MSPKDTPDTPDVETLKTYQERQEAMQRAVEEYNRVHAADKHAIDVIVEGGGMRAVSLGNIGHIGNTQVVNAFAGHIGPEAWSPAQERARARAWDGIEVPCTDDANPPTTKPQDEPPDAA